MNEGIKIDLEKAIHFDPEKIKKMYDGDYKRVAKDLAIENTKLHIANSVKEQQIKKAIKYINKTDFIGKGYINFMYELEKILKGEE